MKNKEKYFDEILKAFADAYIDDAICDFKGHHILKPKKCGEISCDECEKRTREWLEEEYKEQLTEDEKAILRNINKCFKYITRDSGGLMIFEGKPRLVMYEDAENKDYSIAWISEWGQRVSLKPFNHLFTFIKYEDTEPYNIDSLLKQNGVER